MRVCVVGLGYIGLPTAAMLANGGHDVVGVDVNRELLVALAHGEPPVAEQGIADVTKQALSSGRLQPSARVAPSDAFIICVPTPTVDHRPELTAVHQAADAVAAVATDGNLIILESTVPPGTTERIIAGALRRAGKDPDATAIVHCPERVIPGKTIEELTENDRIIGGRREGDAASAADLYRSFVRGRIHCTDCKTAEFVKVVENTYRDVNIAFANELALLAEELDVDVWETIGLANNHPRVDILSPGPGVGGHCIPVDPHFLSNANPFVTELIQAARRINERMPHVVVRKVMQSTPLRRGATKIALLGASYKADVDDTRESPTARVDELLCEQGYGTAIYDPLAKSFVRPLASSLDEAIEDADAVVLITPHSAFRDLDPQAIGRMMRRCVLIDARAFFERERWQNAGFETHVLGSRRQVVAALAELAS